MYNRARLQENGWFTVQCGKPFMICHDLSRKWRASKPVKCRQGLYPTPERLDAVSKFLRTLQNVDVKASGITEVRPSRKHWHYKPHGKPRLIDECSTVLRESLKCCDSTMLWTGVLGIKLILALKKMHRYQNVARFLCHTLRNWRAAQSAPLINYSYLDYLRIYYSKYTIYTVLEDLIWTWKRITLENPSRCTMLCAHFSCFLSLSLSLSPSISCSCI